MVQHTFCPNRIAQYIYRISPHEVTVVHPYSLNERSTGRHYPLCCYHGDYNRPQPQRWVIIVNTFLLCTTATKVQKLLYTWFLHQHWNCAYLKVTNSLFFTLAADSWLVKFRRDHQEKIQRGYPQLFPQQQLILQLYRWKGKNQTLHHHHQGKSLRFIFPVPFLYSVIFLRIKLTSMYGRRGNRLLGPSAPSVQRRFPDQEPWR